MKKALILCPDTKPADSLEYMLKRLHIDTFTPSPRLWNLLHRMGVNLVINNETLVTSWGYPPSLLQELQEGIRPDFIFDIKGHQNKDLLKKVFPKAKVIWYRINGGEPEDHPSGNEINPGIPIVTPNQWYATEKYTGEDRYVFWPKLIKRPDVNDSVESMERIHYENYLPPMSLIHNFGGWGYGALTQGLKKLGVKVYGRGSPEGLITEKAKTAMLRRSVCLVHPKSTDAPGYAILEALRAGCPVVISKRLLWRSSYNLLSPGKDCLAFDRETHDSLTKEDVEKILEDIRNHIKNLYDPDYNQLIGYAGRSTLKAREWGKDDDVITFTEFMGKL